MTFLIALEMGEVQTLTPIKLRHTGKVIVSIRRSIPEHHAHRAGRVLEAIHGHDCGRVISTTIFRKEMPFINGLLKRRVWLNSFNTAT